MRHMYRTELLQVVRPLVEKWIVLNEMLSRQHQLNSMLSSYHTRNASSDRNNDELVLESLNNGLSSGITELTHSLQTVLHSPLIASSLVMTVEMLARTSNILSNIGQYNERQLINLHDELDAMITVNQNIIDSQDHIDSLGSHIADQLVFPIVDIDLLRVILKAILGTIEPYTIVVDTFPRPVEDNVVLQDHSGEQASCRALLVCLASTPNGELAGNVLDFLGSVHPRTPRLHDNQEDVMAYAAVANVDGFSPPVSPVSQIDSALSTPPVSIYRESYTAVNESVTPPNELGRPDLPPLEAVLALDAMGEACFSYL